MQPIKFLDRRCMFNQLFRRYYALRKDKSRLGWTQYHSGLFSIIFSSHNSYNMSHMLWFIENDKKLCLKAKNKSFFEKSIARKLTNESWLGNIDSRSNHLFILISLFFLPMAQELVSPRLWSRGHHHVVIVTWFNVQGIYENQYKRLNFLIRPTKSRRNHSSKLCVQSSPNL